MPPSGPRPPIRPEGPPNPSDPPHHDHLPASVPEGRRQVHGRLIIAKARAKVRVLSISPPSLHLPSLHLSSAPAARHSPLVINWPDSTDRATPAPAKVELLDRIR